jgi:hypothetical protein
VSEFVPGRVANSRSEVLRAFGRSLGREAHNLPRRPLEKGPPSAERDRG